MAESNLPSWTTGRPRFEYLYLDTGTMSGTATVPASLGGGTFTGTAAVRDNIFRVGVQLSLLVRTMALYEILKTSTFARPAPVLDAPFQLCEQVRRASCPDL